MSDELSKLRLSRVQSAIVTGYLLIIFVDYLYLIYYFDISDTKHCATGSAGDGTGNESLIHSRYTATHFVLKYGKNAKKYIIPRGYFCETLASLKLN